MRCNKCGTQSPDDVRFCPVCGHKLQSDHVGESASPKTDDLPERPAEIRRLLDFQGWAKSGRGGGRYIEACCYAVILVGGTVWCLKIDLTWPLYPLIAGLGLIAWLRRL